MLTDRAVRAIQPAARPFKITDSQGLYLLVTKSGAKCWRYDYRFLDKRKTLAIGTYPDVSLRQAREARDEAKRKLRNGIDPGLKHMPGDNETFQAIALEWHSKNADTWKQTTATQIKKRLERHIFPWIGNYQINEIKAPLLLSVLRRIEAGGSAYLANNMRSTCGRIFRYGVACGYCDRDPSGDLKGALSPAAGNHFASITNPRELGQLLRDLDNYQGTFIVRQALRFAPYVFVRPGELRNAEWLETDAPAKEWRIPSRKMKKKRPHIVPLSVQAISIIDEVRPLTGDSRYLFPNIRNINVPFNNTTFNSALRRMGYTADQLTGHGFRSTASTLLHEQGWGSDIIERQLSHLEGNKVKAAYNYAEHLPERRKMMQAWADYLDGLKAGADVVNFRVK